MYFPLYSDLKSLFGADSLPARRRNLNRCGKNAAITKEIGLQLLIDDSARFNDLLVYQR
jgi:hypothetical protein